MKNIALILLFGFAVTFAANFEFVFPEKINYQSIAPTASPELTKLAKDINQKCPLESIVQKKGGEEKSAEANSTEKVSANKKGAKKEDSADPLLEMGRMLGSLQKSVDNIKTGQNPFFNVALEGVSVDDKYIIFALRYPESVSDDSLYSLLIKFSMVGHAILEGGKATYGKKNDPFTAKNLQMILKSDVDLVLRAVTRNGKYVDLIVEKNKFPIPYVDVPHKNVKKIKGVPAVEIGNQTWMAQNMNKKTPHSKCYENSESNCSKFGRLYPIEEARKVCPAGWHLPSGKEFEQLGKFAKESKALRSRNYDEWGRSMEGSDEFGFKARPSGMGYELSKFKGGYVPPKVTKKQEPGSFSFHFNSEENVAYFWTADLPPSEDTSQYYFDVIEGYYTYLDRMTMGEPFSSTNPSRLGQKRKGKWTEGSDPKKKKLWLSVRCVLND